MAINRLASGKFRGKKSFCWDERVPLALGRFGRAVVPGMCRFAFVFRSRLGVQRLWNHVEPLSKRFRDADSKIRTSAAFPDRRGKSLSRNFERNPERRHVSPKNRGSIQARRRGPEAMKSSLGQMKETGERIDTVIEDSMGRDANGPPRPRETGGE